MIAPALEDITRRIHAACARSGREPGGIRLMGVSKFHDLSRMEEAWDAGIRLFGESRVQEASRKCPEFKAKHPEAEIHLIGSLQRNKTKLAVSLFDCIQSVDRDEVLTSLGEFCAGRESPLPILLELNAGEAAKAGYPDTESLFRAAEKALGFPGLVIRGLMTMAPFTDDPGPIRGAFRALVQAREKLKNRFPGADWSCLSMGMSNDFEIAIEEGATLIRIGTALFGERPL